MCERDVTMPEIENAVKLMKKDKSPGEDGITAEFYQEYWYLIGNELADTIMEIFREKSLSQSKSLCMISLLYKGGKSEDIKN